MFVSRIARLNTAKHTHENNNNNNNNKILSYTFLWKAGFFKENCWKTKEFKPSEYKVRYN